MCLRLMHGTGAFQDPEFTTCVGTLTIPEGFHSICVSQRAMDEVYEGIARTYLQCLVQVSRRKLVKRWSSNVGQSIAEDAKDLHETMLSLVRSLVWY